MSDFTSRASHTVAHLIDWYERVIGITSIRVDFARKRISNSTLASIYAICVNVVFCACMPFIFIYDSDMTEHLKPDAAANLPRNSLIHFAGTAWIVALYVMVLLMLVYRRRHERLYEAVARELFALDRAYFDNVPPQQHIERRFYLLLLAKTVPIIAHLVAGFLGEVYMIDELSVRECAHTVYHLNVFFMVHSRTFHYYATLAQAYKRFQLLNVQLDKLLHTVQAMHVYTACVLHVDNSSLQHLRQSVLTELQQMARAQWRLACLVQRIDSIFFTQIAAVLVAYSMLKIVVGYFSLLVLDGSTLYQFGIIITIMEISAVLVLGFDVFCLFRLSEATTHAHQRAGEILRQYRTEPLMDAVFERCCESFSLQLLPRQLHISMGGMFSLNRETLLALWAFIIRYIILMIQFDLELRLRRLPASVDRYNFGQTKTTPANNFMDVRN